MFRIKNFILNKIVKIYLLTLVIFIIIYFSLLTTSTDARFIVNLIRYFYALSIVYFLAYLSSFLVTHDNSIRYKILILIIFFWSIVLLSTSIVVINFGEYYYRGLYFETLPFFINNILIIVLALFVLLKKKENPLIIYTISILAISLFITDFIAMSNSFHGNDTVGIIWVMVFSLGVIIQLINGLSLLIIFIKAKHKKQLKSEVSDIKFKS